jgi:hypothetical protein
VIVLWVLTSLPLVIPDLDARMRARIFDPNYLHLGWRASTWTPTGNGNGVSTARAGASFLCSCRI